MGGAVPMAVTPGSAGARVADIVGPAATTSPEQQSSAGSGGTDESKFNGEFQEIDLHNKVK
jgi:hypothetical protein